MDIVLKLAVNNRDQGGHWRNKVVCSQAAHGNVPIFGIEDPSRFIRLPISSDDFQMSDQELAETIAAGHEESGSTESDVCLLKLTAPTTDLNTLEIPGPMSIAEIEKRKIWVHVDCCLGINLLLLPTEQSQKLLQLLCQPWVRSFSWDPHKVLGLPNLGMLVVKYKSDREMVQSMGPRYFMSNGGIGGTTIAGDALAHLFFRLDAIGHQGLRFLSYHSFTAARFLANRLENLGYQVTCEPTFRSLGGRELPASLRYLASEFQFEILKALKVTKNWHLAKVNLTTKGREISGIRIVMPIGIAWNRESVDFIAKVFDQCCKQVELGKFATGPNIARVFGYNEKSMRLEAIPQLKLQSAQLIEIPRTWIDQLDNQLWSNGRAFNGGEQTPSQLCSLRTGRPHRILRSMARRQFSRLKIRLAKKSDLQF